MRARYTDTEIGRPKERTVQLFAQLFRLLPAFVPSCRTAHYRHSRPETGLDIAECRSGSGELDGDIGLRQTLRCKFRLFPRIHRKKYRMAPVDKHTFYLVPHRAVSYDDCFHAFLSSSGKDRYCAKVLKTSRCTAYPNGIFPTVRQHHGSLRYSATERTSGV